MIELASVRRRSRVVRVVLLAALLTLVQLDDIRAQTVTFDPPAAVVVAPGKLSVTFKQEVSQSSAEVLVKQLGFQILELRFEDVIITANSFSPFSDQAVAALESHPRVKEVERFSVPIDPEFHVSVVFDNSIDPEEAEWVVSEWRGGDTMILNVRALPKEIVVAVRPGREDAAIEVLKASDLVHDVTYVAEG
jgi:hypothetical protein